MLEPSLLSAWGQNATPGDCPQVAVMCMSSSTGPLSAVQSHYELITERLQLSSEHKVESVTDKDSLCQSFYQALPPY